MDVKNDNFLISHKLTEKKSFSVKLDHIIDLRAKAYAEDRTPVLVIEFVGKNGDKEELICFFSSDVTFTKDGAEI